jgi:hypothetical protein
MDFTFLLQQVVGAKAAEIVNLAATAFRTGLSVTQLADPRDGSSKRLRGACALPAEPFRKLAPMRSRLCRTNGRVRRQGPLDQTSK